VDFKYLTLSLGFALFVVCPRMAVMCSILAKASKVNPYLVAAIGGILAVPFILLMMFFTLRWGFGAAIVLAILTDVLSGIATGTFKLRYGIEVILVGIILWIGVVLIGRISPLVERLIFAVFRR